MAGAHAYNAYKRLDIETASQGKLIVMLFNGAIVRAEEARKALEAGDNNGTHQKLLRAQDIVAELRSALNMDAGELAQNLDSVYEYAHHLLVQANIKKQPKPIDQAIQVLTEMRNTWRDLFEKVAEEESSNGPLPPRINQHGASVLNFEG